MKEYIKVGFVKVYRSFLDWEWYQKSEMVHLWFHILMSANWEETSWQGRTIKRGQLFTTRRKLSVETGISDQTIRTCLNRLKSTNEITIESTKAGMLITVNKWDEYQTFSSGTNQQNNQETNQPPNQQSTNNQPTTNQLIYKEYNNIKESKEEKEIKEVKNSSSVDRREDRGVGEEEKEEKPKPAFAKPTLQQLKDYSQSIGYELDCQRFIDYYDANGWKVGKNPMKDWKAVVRNWRRQDGEKNKPAPIRKAKMPSEGFDPSVWEEFLK